MVVKNKVGMSGQFFIVGAILLSIAFYMGLSAAKPLTTAPTTDMVYLSANIHRELPRALNFGLLDGTPEDTLMDFTRYIYRLMRERYINFTILWVVMRGNGTDAVEVIVGNLMGREVMVNLSMPGISRSITVPNNSTSTTILSAVPEQFNLTIQQPVKSKTVEWRRDKVNLYAFVKLLRGKDFIQDETVV